MLAALRRSCSFERALAVAGFGCVLLCIAIVVRPTFDDLSLYGGHDWDEFSAHRLFTVKALLQFGQPPLWMPYACGGFSEWGSVTGASNLVSPFLPVYLALELRKALRAELLGSLVLCAWGTWLFAGEFCKNAAARAFACLVFVANGRWALQAATGHLWHLEYCYTPWAFWAFERLLAKPRPALGTLCVGAAALGAMIYACGIYPVPQTLLLLAAYAGARAAIERRVRPLLAFSAQATFAFGLAAPKLLPMLIEFGERPRLVDSTEAIGLGVLWQALVASPQTPSSRPAQIPQWGWHEYGMYIGWAPALLVLIGALWWAPRRELSLKVVGLLALVLGLGAFHELAPWTLLHELGPFRSQHVPTRWLYPASLLLGVAAAAAFDRSIEGLAIRRQLTLALLAGCVLMAVDIGREASLPMRHAFWMRMRPFAAAAQFEQHERVPRQLQYVQRDYAPEALPAVMAGSGVLQCTLHMSLNIWSPRGEDGRAREMGARGRGSPGYRGEAFTASGVGTARIIAFSPNELVVEVNGARPGDRLVLNQNFDPGWRVDGRATEPYQKAISAVLTAPSGRLTFHFWPRGLSAGLAVLGVSLLGLLAVWVQRRRARREI